MVTQGKLLKLHHFHPSRRRGAGENVYIRNTAVLRVPGVERCRSFGSAYPWPSYGYDPIEVWRLGPYVDPPGCHCQLLKYAPLRAGSYIRNTAVLRAPGVERCRSFGSAYPWPSYGYVPMRLRGVVCSIFFLYIVQ